MAITVTPKYKPFTYEELVKPLEGYWEKYDKAEEDLESARADVAKLKPIIDSLPTINGKYSEADQQIVDRYNSYLTSLDRLSGELSSSGLTSDVKRQIKGLKASYNSDIDPVFGYIKERKADQNVAKAALEKGDTIYAAHNPFTASLSEYTNPLERPSYHTVSISTLENSGISIGEAITNRMPTSKDPSNNLEDYDALVSGILEGSININNLVNDPRFKDYIQNERKKIKYDTFDAAGQAQIDAALIGGIAKGIKGSIEYKRNYDHSYDPYNDFQPFTMGDRTYIKVKGGYKDITDPNNIQSVSTEEYAIRKAAIAKLDRQAKEEEEDKAKALEKKVNNLSESKNRDLIIKTLGDMHFLHRRDNDPTDRASEFYSALQKKLGLSTKSKITAQNVIEALLGDLKKVDLGSKIDIHTLGSGRGMYIVPADIAAELKNGRFLDHSFDERDLIIGIGGGAFGDYKFATVDADVLNYVIDNDSVLKKDTQKTAQLKELIENQLFGKTTREAQF